MDTLFQGHFMPHGHCYLWKPEIVWLHVISDAIIAVSYFSIPLLLTYLVYRSANRIPFHSFFVLFSIFILACGSTHIMSIINVWQSEYIISGVIKLITAIASIGTAIALIRVFPKFIEDYSKD